MSESAEPPLESTETSAAVSRSARPVWRSPSLLVAAAVMVIGLAVWVFNGSTTGADEERSPGGLEGRSTLMDASSADDPSIGQTPVSPVAFRLGAGYLGGFFLGWALRKFITLALLAAGFLVALLALFQGLGWFEVNWSAVDGHLKLGLEWVQGQAGSFKTFLTGYLPSAGAAGAGLFVGFRRR